MECNPIETIARGILLRDGYVLVCKGKKNGNLYFPGGHVEFGETAAFALEREMAEETGLAARAGTFLGCVEHLFRQEGSMHAEINLVFLMDADASPAREVEALEDWIGFEWIDLSQISARGVEPKILSDNLSGWVNSSKSNPGRILSSFGKENPGMNGPHFQQRRHP